MLQLTIERERRGWTRAELARRAGMHPATVGLIESGRLHPYERQVAKLARALGVAAGDADHLLAKVSGAEGQP